tara:strand:+ start:43 stop:996 length:954 start_codon:yes stop_codon:yes gene_type:complete
MIKLIIRVTAFFVFTLLIFEIYIRIFHLYDDVPKVRLDSNKLLVYKPNQNGSYNFGNRKEVDSKYLINSAGFNSAVEYDFSTNTPKIALIGDSYIEGFHQDVNNSIGRMINRLSDYQCFEYGLSSWTLNDYLNLISSDSTLFNQFEYIFINLNPSDLQFSLYNYWNSEVSKLKVDKQNSFIYKYIYSNVKLLSSANQMGIFNNLGKKIKILSTNNQLESNNNDLQLKNFYEILNYFGIPINNKKLIFIFNSNLKYQESFLNHIKQGYNFIDLSISFNQSADLPYFRFDHHWNNKGRMLVAKEILNKINNLKSKGILN